MLCLSRKEGESIKIGDGIVLTINRIRGDKVSIGIDAPPDVAVMRTELGSPRPKAAQPEEAVAS